MVVVRNKLIAVGLPVARQPPQDPGVRFSQHRAFREYSLPQQGRECGLSYGL